MSIGRAPAQRAPGFEVGFEHDAVAVLRHCSWMLRRLLPVDHVMRLRDLADGTGAASTASPPPVVKGKENRTQCIVDVLTTLDSALRLHKEEVIRSEMERRELRMEMADELLARHAEKVWTAQTFEQHLSKTRFNPATANTGPSRFDRSLSRAYDAAVNSAHARAAVANQLRPLPVAYALADGHALANCTQNAPCWQSAAATAGRGAGAGAPAGASSVLPGFANSNHVGVDMQNAAVAREQLVALRAFGERECRSSSTRPPRKRRDGGPGACDEGQQAKHAKPAASGVAPIVQEI